jgi:hypothetical protein
VRQRTALGVPFRLACVDHGFSQRHLDPPLQSIHLPALQETSFPESNAFALRASNGRHPDRSSAGIPQHPAAGASRSPGGVNVIDQQHVTSRQALGMGRKKSATQILPALVSGQACLTHRHSHAFQQARFQVQPPLGVAAAHLRHGRAGQQLGMIKPPQALLGCVHGHRDHQHLSRRSSKGFQAVRQENTQTSGNGLHTLILEQMNQRSQLTVVSAIGNGFNERRRS